MLNNILLCGYPVLLLILVFYRAEFTGPGQTAGEYLSRKQSGMIRAAACLGVILHHLVQRATGYGAAGKGPITLFNYTGILFTALFFFFSGYGLLTSYNTKPGYLDSFLWKRLPTVLFPFWTINFLGILLNYFIYGIVHKSPAMYLSELTGFTLVNGNGWFIIEIVILYLAFYLLFMEIRNKDAALALLCVFTAALIVYGFNRGHDPKGNQVHWFKGEWWFNSTAAFIFGLLYARFRRQADAFFRKYYPVILPSAVVLLAVSFQASVYTVVHFGYYHDTISSFTRRRELITLFSQIAVCFLFVMAVLLLNMRITLHSRILQFVDGISMELFLIHGYFVNRIFANVRMRDPLRFAAVFLCSMASAWAVSFFTRRASAGFIRKFGRKTIPRCTLESEAKRRKRDRTLKLLAGTALVSGSLFVLYREVGEAVFAGSEYREEYRMIQSAVVGDEVLWGHFETDRSRIGRERLTWIVVKREGGRVCLLSKEGIAGSSYNRKHEKVSWEESDLRELLNSSTFTKMFSSYEEKSVVRVNGDMISLLTAEEAEELFDSDRQRELMVTSAAEQDGTNVNRLSKANYWDMKGYRSSWWWLRGRNGERSITAPVVTVDGKVSLEEKTVNRPGGAIRPVIWLSVSSDKV